MKHTALFTLLFAGALAAHADDTYTYLNVEKTDGTTISLTAVGLTITYSGTTLTATNGTESETLTLSELSRMYFSNTKSDSSGISDIIVDGATIAGADEVYDLQGRRLPKGSTPRKGIYIIRANGKTTKVQVR